MNTSYVEIAVLTFVKKVIKWVGLSSVKYKPKHIIRRKQRILREACR